MIEEAPLCSDPIDFTPIDLSIDRVGITMIYHGCSIAEIQTIHIYSCHP